MVSSLIRMMSRTTSGRQLEGITGAIQYGRNPRAGKDRYNALSRGQFCSIMSPGLRVPLEMGGPRNNTIARKMFWFPGRR
jgi:hypothetical protein